MAEPLEPDLGATTRWRAIGQRGFGGVLQDACFGTSSAATPAPSDGVANHEFAIARGACALVVAFLAGFATLPASAPAVGDRVVFREGDGVSLGDPANLQTKERITESGLQPALSPNGQQVVYTDHLASSYTGGSRIWVATIGGATPKLILSVPRDAGGNQLAAVNHPRFSADGQWVVYTYWPNYVSASNPGEAAIWRMRRDGTQRQKLIDWAGNQQWASYNANGSKLALLSTHRPDGTALPAQGDEPAETYGQLFIVDANGANPRQLTDNVPEPRLHSLGDPTFSPDGTKIIFHAEARGGRHHIFRTDLSGVVREMSTLLNPDVTSCSQGAGSGGVNPSWSPDGRYIVYKTSDACNSAVRMTSDGTGHVVIYPLAGVYWRTPRYRPVGTSLMTLEFRAHKFRPRLLFDEGEHWRPLKLDPFLGEAQHRLCSGTNCTTATALTDLRNYTRSTDQLDIAGQGNADNFKSPRAGCVDGDRWECDTGINTAMYWHESVPSPLGYRYMDYWLFYRYNDHVETTDHEGDWESVSVAPSKANPDTFDFASFSAHGHWYSYLRDNLSCEPSSDKGSCGTEAAKSGQRVNSFIAGGGHSNYAQPCSGIIQCTQTNSARPENDHGGERPWGANSDSSTLLKMPATTAPGTDWALGPRNWVDWPGTWSADGEIRAPAVSPNKAHYDVPWVNECADDSNCPPEQSNLRARVRRVRFRSGPARSRVRPERSRFELCESWFGAGVSVLACDGRRLRKALQTARLGAKGDFKVARLGRARGDSAPGLAQTTAQPLHAGDRVTISGTASPRARLYVRVKHGGRLFEAKFFRIGLTARRGSSVLHVRTAAVRTRSAAASKRPILVLRRADGKTVRPSQLRAVARRR